MRLARLEKAQIFSRVHKLTARHVKFVSQAAFLCKTESEMSGRREAGPETRANRQDNKNAYGNFMQIFTVAAICNKFSREIV